MPSLGARTFLTLAVVALPAAAILSSAGPAGATADRKCTPVRATAVGQDLGPDSAGVLHTTATVSFDGNPVATSNASFTPGTMSGTVLAFSGPIVFTSDLTTATLTANVDGSVDLSTGRFSATSTSVSGTDVLSGVRGHLRFRGQEDLATGAFTENVGGRLCARS